MADEQKLVENFELISHYEYHFDWLLIHSLFISAYAHFENYLRRNAEIIEDLTISNIKLKDIKGNSDIDTYRKYIHLIGNINSANAGLNEWSILLQYKDVRNAIIHKSGYVKKANNLMKKHNIFFGPSETLIRIKNVKFLVDFIDHSTEYMNKVSTEIKDSAKNYAP